MLVKTYNLDYNFQRPIIRLQDDIKALLDTGSKYPVWCGPSWLYKAKHGILISEKPVYFTGFGGKAEALLGRIDFQFGDIVYPNMPILVTEMPNMNEHIILAASNFDNMIYEIDNVNHKLTIKIPDDNIIRTLVMRTDNDKIEICSCM